MKNLKGVHVLVAATLAVFGLASSADAGNRPRVRRATAAWGKMSRATLALVSDDGALSTAKTDASQPTLFSLQ